MKASPPAPTLGMTMPDPVHGIDFDAHDFHPVVHIPVNPVVLDLTAGAPVERFQEGEWTIGRYDEKRSIYTSELFSGGRSIHIGLDIGGPVGTPVHAFADGILYAAGYNSAKGDYGHVVVTQHRLDDVDLWALHGHLDAASSERSVVGSEIRRGEILGWFGDQHENGGWPPHLHFQLGIVEPEGHDMPGVIREQDREWALEAHPDPRLVLGPLH